MSTDLAIHIFRILTKEVIKGKKKIKFCALFYSDNYHVINSGKNLSIKNTQQ
jgi:hypothetical protein